MARDFGSIATSLIMMVDEMEDLDRNRGNARVET
jgi:hypothetical protein